MIKHKFVFLQLFLAAMRLFAQQSNFMEQNDVTWNFLGTNENDSMPLGNGDVALNVWTEQNGDIVLLLAKSDAWSENGQLLKLGRVRVKLKPNPFCRVCFHHANIEIGDWGSSTPGGQEYRANLGGCKPSGCAF